MKNAILIALMLAALIFIAGCTSKTPTAPPENNSAPATPPQTPSIPPAENPPAANITPPAENPLTYGGLFESDLTIDQPAEENITFDEPPAL